MTELVRNGIFVSPLYHGTTTLFVESIKKYGLGGRDIVKEWNLVKVYGELFNLAEEKLVKSDVWQKGRKRASYIALQKNSEDEFNFNFSHGHAYVTPDRKTARKYANIEEGCEMLQYIKGLALLLAGKGLFFEVKKIIPKEIEDVLTKNYEPILLELHDVKWCDVEPENGTDKEHLLSLWSVAFEKNIDPRELTSWRLKNPYSGKLKIIA